MMKRAIGLLLVFVFSVMGLSVFAEASMGCGIGVMAAGMGAVKSGGYGEKIRLLPEDFTRAACVTDFESITVTRLPMESEGTLLLAGRRVKSGQTVKKRALSNFIFVPKNRSVTEASFSFRINGAGTGEEICFTLRFTSDKGSAPTVAEDAILSFSTQADIPIIGKLSGGDADGDRIEFITVVPPTSGALVISDRTTGNFTYTPMPGYVGRDEASYVIRDEYGNFSEVIGIVLNVGERLSSVVLSDMENRSEYGAAVAMCAMGIMGVSERGGLYYFSPDERVTRADFVMMAMKVCGIEPSGEKSFFDDDAEVPAPMRGYISAAAKSGFIDGDFGDGGLVFRPNDTVTRLDAAVMLSRMLGISGGVEDEVFSPLDGVPCWAARWVSAAVTLGLFELSGEQFFGDEGLSRAEAAECLYRLAKVN